LSTAHAEGQAVALLGKHMPEVLGACSGWARRMSDALKQEGII